jgi:hypothetical protein
MIHLFSTGEGGREGPIRSGYRSMVHFLSNPEWKTNDAIMTLEDRDSCSPGDACPARLRFLSPELVQSLLAPTEPFELMEGGRRVGRGEILNLMMAGTA